MAQIQIPLHFLALAQSYKHELHSWQNIPVLFFEAQIEKEWMNKPVNEQIDSLGRFCEVEKKKWMQSQACDIEV